MKRIFNAISIAGLLLVLFFPSTVRAQNFAAVHWVNDAGQRGDTVLNTNGIFTTDYKAHNDVTVTPISAGSVVLYTDVFGGASPGNNPGYITNFTGVVTNGTGDGTAGDIEDLEMTYSATGTLQFDFATPLTPQDRILLIDVDYNEQYLVQAYAFNGTSYVQVSLAGWNYQNFSGTTGMTPDSTWPVWNPTTGTLTSGSSANLNEELSVLTPNQNIDRLVIIKQSGNGYSTDITFLSLKTPLAIRQSGANMVLNWTNSAFNLQSAPVVTGTYTNVPGATSPYTNAINGSQQFFRLIAN
jgi:hypothetical protein